MVHGDIKINAESAVYLKESMSIPLKIGNIYLRPLKLRTDGAYGQTRVRELGSIDLFVVTSLKMNELSPNYEHKLLIMCGMLAADFIAMRSPFLPVLLWPPVMQLAGRRPL